MNAQKATELLFAGRKVRCKNWPPGRYIRWDASKNMIINSVGGLGLAPVYGKDHDFEWEVPTAITYRNFRKELDLCDDKELCFKKITAFVEEKCVMRVKITKATGVIKLVWEIVPDVHPSPFNNAVHQICRSHTANWSLSGTQVDLPILGETKLVLPTKSTCYPTQREVDEVFKNLVNTLNAFANWLEKSVLK